MRRLIGWMLCGWLSITILPAQSPYTITGGIDGSLGGGGASLLVASILVDRQVEPLTAEEIAQLRLEKIWIVDRWVTRQWSPTAQSASDAFLLGSLISPAALLLDRPSRAHFGQVGLFSLESLLLTAGLTNLTKTLVRRPRPYVYNPDIPLEFKVRKNDRYAFFSGHTSLAATMTFLSAKLYNDFHPNSPARPYVWAAAVAVPALTGYLRIRGGKHYLTDVLVGFGVGAAVGILVPELHK